MILYSLLLYYVNWSTSVPSESHMIYDSLKSSNLPAISDKWPPSLQLIQDGDTVQASTSVDPVTEADVGQSVVQTVVKTMSQVVPTAGSEVEPTEIPSIADQQAQATAAAADQEIIETQTAVQDSSVLDQGGDVVSQDTGGLHSWYLTTIYQTGYG